MSEIEKLEENDAGWSQYKMFVLQGLKDIKDSVTNNAIEIKNQIAQISCTFNEKLFSTNKEVDKLEERIKHLEASSAIHDTKLSNVWVVTATISTIITLSGVVVSIIMHFVK